MPVHYAKTKVTLFTWDPCQGEDDPTGEIPNGYRAIQPLGEEWFEGQENLQLLDSGAVLPYYLVNAGRSLIFGETTPPQSSPTALQILQTAVEKLKQENPVIEQAASSSGLRSSSRPEVPGPESLHIDADTTQSSIATSEKEHKEGYPDPDSNRDENWPDIEDGPTNNISQKGGNKKGVNAVPAELIVKQVWESPIGSPIPLKLQFECHRETFQRSINEFHFYRQRPLKNLKALIKNPGRHQDICITIFYNGELTHSRTVAAENSIGSQSKARRVDFSGRRIQYKLEVPWAICQVEKNAPITDSSFGERWNEVNQMLATEADKWGRAGKAKLFRSPMGEYLEAMSKLPMPEGARKWNERGGRAGIIDLVVTIGRQFSGDRDTGTKRLNVVEPARKLYQGYMGKVQQFHVVDEERARQQQEKILDERLKSRSALSGSSAASASKEDSPRRKVGKSNPVQKSPRPGHMFATNTKRHVNKARTSDGTNGFGEHHTAHEAADSHEGFGLDGSGSKSKRNTKAQTSAVNPPSGSSAKRKRSVEVPTSRVDDDTPPASNFNSETTNTHGAGTRRSSRGKSESCGPTIVVTVPKTVDESVSDNPRPQKRPKPEIKNQPASSQVNGYSAPSSSNTTQKSKNSKSKNSAASKPTGRAALRKNVADLTVPSQDSPSFEEDTTLPRDGSSTFFKSPAEQHPTQSGPATEPDKKKRAPSRAMCARELSSLLKPHEKSEKVDNSFGSFLETEASNGPVRRKSNKKQSKGPTPKETQPTAARSPRVTATTQGPIIKFKDKGANGAETENSGPGVLANSTKAEEPIERAKNITVTAKVSQAKTKAAGNTSKPTKSAPTRPLEETVKSSNGLTSITDNSPMIQDSSSSTSTLTKMSKVSESEANKGSDNPVTRPGTTEMLPTAYPSIANPKAKPKAKPKPNMNINPSLANKRSYSENSQGLKTPTPKTDTFDVPKGTDSTISTFEPSSHLAMQDAPFSFRSTTLQPVVPSLFGDNTYTYAGAVRAAFPHSNFPYSWGSHEQLSIPYITPTPLALHATQPPPPVMSQPQCPPFYPPPPASWGRGGPPGPGGFSPMPYSGPSGWYPGTQGGNPPGPFPPYGYPQDQDRKGKVKGSNTSVPSISRDEKGKGKEMAFQSPVSQRGEIDEGIETMVPAPTLRLRNVEGNGTERIILTNSEDRPTPDGDAFVRTAVNPQPWAPNSICQDSLLTYGSDSAHWEGMERDNKSAHFCREVSFEREGLFRASGVLFGVRFVVGLGAEESELELVPETGAPGAGNPDIDVGRADADAEELDKYDA